MFRVGRLGAVGAGVGFPQVADGILANLDIDFVNNVSFVNGVIRNSTAPLTVTRTQTNGTATNLLPSSPSGFAYSTYAANIARRDTTGLLVEEGRTNQLKNSAAPVTQTTASLGTGNYVLWVNGSGSATSSAGTATITGAGAATQGSPNIFVVTVAGTVTVTVSGSLNAFQLEQCPFGTAGFFGSSLIVTTSSTGARAADTVTASLSVGGTSTLYIQGSPNAPATYTIFQAIGYISDGTTSNRFGIGRNGTSNTTNFLDVLATTTIYNQSSTTWAQATKAKAALAQQNGRQQGCFNTAIVTAGTAATTPASLTGVSIGNGGNGGSQWDGYINRVSVWTSTCISNSGLQKLTT